MVTKQEILEGSRLFISKQVDVLAESNGLLKLAKPLVTRFIDNNMYKFEKALDFFADKEGMIDAEGIISDVTSNIINSKPFTVNNKLVGDILIGEGQVKFNIPFINQKLVLNHSDLEGWKNLITKKGIL